MYRGWLCCLKAQVCVVTAIYRAGSCLHAIFIPTSQAYRIPYHPRPPPQNANRSTPTRRLRLRNPKPLPQNNPLRNPKDTPQCHLILRPKSPFHQPLHKPPIHKPQPLHLLPRDQSAHQPMHRPPDGPKVRRRIRMFLPRVQLLGHERPGSLPEHPFLRQRVGARVVADFHAGG